ncbi:MAG: hypothetical protein ACLR7U_07260 [Ruthenibacterium lactatiformans]
MTELNEAFDALMGAIRTGTPVNSRRTANAGEPEPDTGAAANGRYRAIRQMINSGAVEQALAELNAIQGGANDAEWNFLVGSAYYYKGWVADALRAISRRRAALLRATGNMMSRAQFAEQRERRDARQPLWEQRYGGRSGRGLLLLRHVHGHDVHGHVLRLRPGRLLTPCRNAAVKAVRSRFPACSARWPPS